MKRIGKLWTDLIRALLLCLVLVLGLTAGGGLLLPGKPSWSTMSRK